MVVPKGGEDPPNTGVSEIAVKRPSVECRHEDGQYGMLLSAVVGFDNMLTS